MLGLLPIRVSKARFIFLFCPFCSLVAAPRMKTPAKLQNQKKNVLFYIYGTHSIPREATPAGTTSLGGWSGRKQKNCSGNIYRLLFFFRETELLFGSADRMSSRFGGPNGCSVIADRTSIRHRVLNLFRVLVGLTSVRLFGRLDACVFLFIRSNFDSADRTILLLLGGADE